MNDEPPLVETTDCAEEVPHFNRVHVLLWITRPFIDVLARSLGRTGQTRVGVANRSLIYNVLLQHN